MTALADHRNLADQLPGPQKCETSPLADISERPSTSWRQCKQADGVAPGNLPCYAGRQLFEPRPVAAHDLSVLVPALVDPCVGAEQEAFRVALEQLAPLGGNRSGAVADSAAIGEFGNQAGVGAEHAFDFGRRQ
jgi:hypothetical protein